MKTVVAVHDLLELEIKPDSLLAEFSRLTATSVKSLLVPHATQEVPCPGCSRSDSDLAFGKFSLSYRSCRHCGSVFVSPRPTQAVLDEYYRTAPAPMFWREHILPATELVRAVKIARPRAEWVSDGLVEHARDARNGIDLSPQTSAFVEALIELSRIERVIVSNATAHIDWQDPPPGVTLLTEGLSAITAPFPVDFVVAFDVIDRCADLPGLVAAASRALRPGGLLFVAGPSISGFDLQVLWERSRAITPPDRINLLSVRGFQELFSSEDWDIRELSTPGMFDSEAVRRAMLSEPQRPWPRVLRQLLVDSGPAVVAALQEFLQRHRLSSFARLLVQRRAAKGTVS